MDADHPRAASGDGFTPLLGLHYGHRNAETAELFLTVEAKHLNYGGIVHGGVMCSLLDNVIGYAVTYGMSAESRARTVTIDLHTRFHAPGRGGTLKAVGRVDPGAGRKILHCSAEVLDETGELLASAVGTWRAGGPRGEAFD